MTFRLRCLDTPSSDGSHDTATATPATSATGEIGEMCCVADVATVAVASPCDTPSSATPALERRREQVERKLGAHPELRVVADALDAPLRGEPGSPVSVVIAVRTGIGIVSGELRVPRDRFDAGLFMQTLTQTVGNPV